MTTTAAAPIGVLVVDDAVIVRRMVSDVLAEDPLLRVVGTAANGRIALQKLTQVQPQVITLDFEMPEMNGLETLKAIRKTHPQLPVIMFSSLTERGGRETLDALAAGASDYVTKPTHAASMVEAHQRVREQLVPKIKALCNKPQISAPSARPVVRLSGAARHACRPEAIVIGVSTGGPNALAALLPQLPAQLPVPVLIVQHMPPVFTKLLADRLNAQSGLRIIEAKGGETPEAGTVYLAPGDFHMSVQSGPAGPTIVLDQNPRENSCRPAADVLFRTASAVYGDRLLGVVLTGMGQDGLRGSEEIRRLQGEILVQDEASSVVWGMPGFVAQAGLADGVFPLADLAAEIVRRCERPVAPAGMRRTM